MERSAQLKPVSPTAPLTRPKRTLSAPTISRPYPPVGQPGNRTNALGVPPAAGFQPNEALRAVQAKMRLGSLRRTTSTETVPLGKYPNSNLSIYRIPVVQRAAGGALAGAGAGPIVAPPPPPPAAVAYINNFNVKHTAVAVTADSAKNQGNARDPKPAFNTVLRQAYLEGVIRAHALGRGAGNYVFSERASVAAAAAGGPNISLAELKVSSQTYKTIAVGMFSYAVSYSVAAGGAITISHLETA